MIRFDCPPAARWTALLADDLPRDEELALQAHLDRCPDCQRVLENCAADRASWSAVPRWLSATEPDMPLRSAMASLKNAPADSLVTIDMELDFLDPSDSAGSLGRLNNYEVIEEIGRGGMGIVLKALDPTLHRVVAIKVLVPQLAVSGSARKRFTREARAAAAVCHEHVVTIHAVEEFKSLPYLVMQYVAGQSLQQKLDAHGPMPVADILRIGRQAALGLAAAHAQGLVHRDVKPANMLLENGVERVRLSDFGLARAVADAGVTSSGVVTGTPQYMAPEQARSQPLDARADLFSLGSVLYAMCTGRAPFRGNDALDVLRKVGETEPRPIREQNPDIPAWLEAIVAKLMAKDPADRFTTAAEVAKLLEQCLAHVQNPSVTPLPPIPGHAPRFATLRRSVWARRAALILPILAGIFVVTEATGYTQVMQALGTVLRFKAEEGTLVVEIDDPSIKVTLDGKDLVIAGAGAQEIRLKPGSYTLRATKDGQTKTEIVHVTRDGRSTVKVSFESQTAKRDSKLLPHEPEKRLLPLGIFAQTALASNAPTPFIATFPSGKEGNGVMVWDVHKGEKTVLLETRLPSPVPTDLLNSCKLTVSANGAAVALAHGNTATVWHTGASVWDTRLHPIRLRVSPSHEGEISVIAFAPDGQFLATAGKSDGLVRIWNVHQAYEVQQLRLPSSPPTLLSFDGGARKLLTSHGKSIKVFNLATKEEANTSRTTSSSARSFLMMGKLSPSVGQSS